MVGRKSSRCPRLWTTRVDVCGGRQARLIGSASRVVIARPRLPVRNVKIAGSSSHRLRCLLGALDGAAAGFCSLPAPPRPVISQVCHLSLSHTRTRSHPRAASLSSLQPVLNDFSPFLFDFILPERRLRSGNFLRFWATPRSLVYEEQKKRRLGGVVSLTTCDRDSRTCNCETPVSLPHRHRLLVVGYAAHRRQGHRRRYRPDQQQPAVPSLPETRSTGDVFFRSPFWTCCCIRCAIL